jgi:hypothetical protein
VPLQGARTARSVGKSFDSRNDAPVREDLVCEIADAEPNGIPTNGSMSPLPDCALIDGSEVDVLVDQIVIGKRICPPRTSPCRRCGYRVAMFD